MRRTVRICALALCLSVATVGEDVWTGVERVVAVGDVHGDYEAFVSVLRASGLIDDKGKWSGGKTHLVQTGDVVDRGPDSRKVIDLLMQLERQSRSAGGFVHSLMGNHEAMNVYGDLRYVHQGEYESFRTGDSARIRDSFFDQHVEDLRRTPGALKIDDAYRKKWEQEHPLGFFEHRYEYGPGGKYGRRIRRLDALVKINDVLFLHAGISPKYAVYTIRELNDRIRKELDDFEKLKEGFVLDQTVGPLWYRGLASEDGEEIRSHVDALLSKYGVSRIVIGHTVTGGAVLPRFGGKVVMIDVGMSRAYGGPPAALVIEKGLPHAVHRGRKLPLPAAAPDLLRYLKQVAGLEPSNSQVAKQAADLEAALAASAPK
ncbi:MAG: metallophosphoesterase [Bryobacteraceae bacterium]